MTQKFKTELHHYFKDTRRYLCHYSKNNKKSLQMWEKSVRSFVEEYAIQDMADVYAQFGSPKDVAESYVEDISYTKLSHKLQWKRLLLSTLLVLSVIGIIWLIGFIIDVLHSMPDYAVIEITG